MGATSAYPAILAYLMRLLDIPAFAEYVRTAQIRPDYYSIKALNPSGIVPAGPDVDHLRAIGDAVPFPRRQPNHPTIEAHTMTLLPSRFSLLHAAALTVFLALGAADVTRAADSELSKYQTAAKIATQHLATFDTLDFDVFTNQKWDRLKESHAPDIAVHWPDGHVTHGLLRHTADLKAMFVYAPDTRIHEHPVRISNGEWTSVIGVMEGTFTQPMPIGDGKSIPPTGKSFKLIMCTVGHWKKDGTMDEEYLFWDNQTYMAQLGLGK